MKNTLAKVFTGLIIASLLGGCASVFVPEPGFLNEGSTYRFTTETDFGNAKVLKVRRDGWIKLEKQMGNEQNVQFWYNTQSGVAINRAPEMMIEDAEQE